MAKINIYLTFEGQCEAAFEFYRSVFGGEFGYIGRFNEMPPQEGAPPLSEEEANRIMHVVLPISHETSLYGSDVVGGWGQSVFVGNNFSISISADSKEEADRLFNGLSSGGTVTMPLQDTFWGAYYGMFIDKFMIHWMVNYDYPQQHDAE